MRKSLLFCLFVVINYTSCAFAQSGFCPQNQYAFRYLTIDQGLSNNYILSICQDSKGFIWLGTENGLSKFDGQTVINYLPDPVDSNSISSKRINCVIKDSHNTIWVGGNRGLERYDADYDYFIPFRLDSISYSLGAVYAIAEDKEENLWFGGDSGLFRYNLRTSDLKIFSNKPGNVYGIPSCIAYQIMVSHDNKIWISFLNKGLWVYDPKNDKIRFYQHDSEDECSLSGNRIEKIYEDAQNNIWIGTFNSGLNLYNPAKDNFKRLLIDPNNTYSSRVRAIYEDLRGDFFVGTRAGVYLFRKTTDDFILYADEGHNFSKLSQNSVTTSFIDKSGTLWLGTFSGGANYTNLNRKEFVHYIAGKDDNHYLSGSNIYAITEDKNGNLWVGGDNGLNYLDRSNCTFTYFTNDPNDPNSLSYNDIKSFAWDKNQNLWIATNKGGLNYYDVTTGKFTAFKHDPDNPNSIIGDKVYCLLMDKYNNLWIIISASSDFSYLSVDVLPDNSKKFIHLKEKAYFGFDQNEKGDVFIGGVGGVWYFSRSDSTFDYISNENIIGRVQCLKIDSHNTLWIGSDKGLVGYSAEDQSFVAYSQQNGYPIGTVYGILEDKNTNLWLSTNSGLLKVSNIITDPSRKSIRVFDHDDGLQSKQFNYNAFYKCRSGEMVFGGINGFNTFFPEQIIENKSPTEVVITDLKVFNNSVPIGKEINGQVILKKSISVTDEISLNPKQKIFTLEFASPQSKHTDKDIFRIKLVGLDKEWQYRKSGNNFVTYTNLSPGEYTFMVSAVNRDGYWNEEPLKLKINVIPPFWKTWGFRILFSFGLMMLIYSIYYSRIKMVRRQNLILEQKVKSRTEEVVEKNNMLREANILLQEKQEEILTQNEELESHRTKLEDLVLERTSKLALALDKAKESDALKSAFLANMSHEVRTPMNAILGFANLLDNDEYNKEEKIEFVQIIQSNSHSLLKIIDEILDLSIIESNQLKITNEVFELNVFFDQLFSYYEMNKKKPQLILKNNNLLKGGNVKLKSDSIRIKQVLINLMDNAIKFTERGFVEMGVLKQDEELCFYVHDTGRGIPSADLKRIFNHFIKLEDENQSWTEGLGLGLAISYNIAEALGGKLKVQSTLGKGSVFSFCLPAEVVVSEDVLYERERQDFRTESWKDKTILIAEDVEINFIYLSKILEKTGTNILRAKDGQEAIELANNNPQIDLILMDIKMPNVSGFDAARIIKEKNPDKIIIAQTAYARYNEQQKYSGNVFDDYLSKPINQSDLLITLRKFL